MLSEPDKGIYRSLIGVGKDSRPPLRQHPLHLCGDVGDPLAPHLHRIDVLLQDHLLPVMGEFERLQPVVVRLGLARLVRRPGMTMTQHKGIELLACLALLCF